MACANSLTAFRSGSEISRSARMLKTCGQVTAKIPATVAVDLGVSYFNVVQDTSNLSAVSWRSQPNTRRTARKHLRSRCCFPKACRPRQKLSAGVLTGTGSQVRHVLWVAVRRATALRASSALFATCNRAGYLTKNSSLSISERSDRTVLSLIEVRNELSQAEN